jgi:hypothetical protein
MLFSGNENHGSYLLGKSLPILHLIESFLKVSAAVNHRNVNSYTTVLLTKKRVFFCKAQMLDNY